MLTGPLGNNVPFARFDTISDTTWGFGDLAPFGSLQIKATPSPSFLLGNQYANGGGVPQDFSEAMIWFGRAAAQAHPIAMLHLGAMYAEGRGVPQDYVRAHMWFSLAAARGQQIAVKTLEMAERKMTQLR